ncbi:receptor-type tyrosine-protein phosphatase beta-like [Branchiostoma floridae x Branchiostoma japonicum]
MDQNTLVAKPQKIVVGQREETSLTLNWDSAKGDKGGYLVTIEPLVSEPSSNKVVSTNFIENKEGPMSFIFHNLQPGRKYVLTLKTESCGDYSEAVKIEAKTLVSPPNNLKVVNITTNNMTLAWSEAGGDKDYYNIKISPAEGPNPTGQVAKGEGTSYTFSGLTPGKQYIVSIWTVSGGARSQSKTIPNRTIPNAPGNVVSTIVDKGIRINWQPVEGEWENYVLHLKPTNDRHESCDMWHTIGKRDLTSHVFADLTYGRRYEITVQTVSDNRKSSPFRIFQRLTIDPPKALKETGREEKRIAVAWETATGDKDFYRVQLRDHNGLLKEEETEDTTWSFDGLVPGTLYTICVQTVCEEETSKEETTAVRTVTCSPSSVVVEDSATKSKAKE